MADDEDDFEKKYFDGHAIHDEQPFLEILGVVCICACGRSFVACIGCLINGTVNCCPTCDIQMQNARLN
jgi:hypothetical protein